MYLTFYYMGSSIILWYEVFALANIMQLFWYKVFQNMKESSTNTWQ
jgi:hypothetical protein